MTDVNEAPVAADDTATTPEDTAVDIAVLSNDSDPDEGDDASDLTVTIKTAARRTAPRTVKADGKVTYTPAKDFNGEDSFVYEAADDDGLKDEATVTVTVGAVNDPPVIRRCRHPGGRGEHGDRHGLRGARCRRRTRTTTPRSPTPWAARTRRRSRSSPRPAS